MIKKIIVELADHEATFQEFSSFEALVASDLFKVEYGTVTAFTPVEVEAENVLDSIPRTDTVEVPVETPAEATPVAEVAPEITPTA